MGLPHLIITFQLLQSKFCRLSCGSYPLFANTIHFFSLFPPLPLHPCWYLVKFGLFVYYIWKGKGGGGNASEWLKEASVPISSERTPLFSPALPAQTGLHQKQGLSVSATLGIYFWFHFKQPDVLSSQPGLTVPWKTRSLTADHGCFSALESVGVLWVLFV